MLTILWVIGIILYLICGLLVGKLAYHVGIAKNEKGSSYIDSNTYRSYTFERDEIHYLNFIFSVVFFPVALVLLLLFGSLFHFNKIVDPIDNLFRKFVGASDEKIEKPKLVKPPRKP